MFSSNNDNSYNNKKPIERFLSFLIKIGNSVIVGVGIVFFGIKKLIFIFDKGKSKQSLADFKRNLKKQLDESTAHFSVKNNAQPYQKYIPKYPSTYKASATNIASKASPKPHNFNKKQLLYVAGSICIVVIFVFVGMAATNIKNTNKLSITSELMDMMRFLK